MFANNNMHVSSYVFDLDLLVNAVFDERLFEFMKLDVELDVKLFCLIF
jgi:hypothetical protein